MRILQFLFLLFLTAMISVSCTKYKELVDATYPDQILYMPAAVEPNSTNGIYQVNSVAAPGLSYRYMADAATGKLNIPLAVYRSGLSAGGAVSSSIHSNTDTIARLLSLGKLPAGTEVLPADKFTIPSSVTLGDGTVSESFNLSVDLNFLLANVTRKFAIGIGLSSKEKALGRYSTTIVLLDPAFLIPSANFTTTISGRTVTFSNNSLHAARFVWDYGDGTPLSSEKAASHTYANAGTYNVKLVATGALGDANKSTFTSSVVIP